MSFIDRQDAGQRLAGLLQKYRGQNVLVLGLPRGGVPVAFEVARSLGGELGVWAVRKLGAPQQPELAIGAIAEGGGHFVNEALVAELGLTEAELAAVTDRAKHELEVRVRDLRADGSLPDVRGRIVIVVDDGVATGATARAALEAISTRAPRHLVAAFPVGAPDSVQDLRAYADEVVCLETPEALGAVGVWYSDFGQTTDEEVAELLQLARSGEPAFAVNERGARSMEREITIEADGTPLQATISVPPSARGVVIFAHGSGSSRHSPRNRYVAAMLRRANLATLLLDLLTEGEEASDLMTAEWRFNVHLLGGRLAAVTRWVSKQPALRNLRIGFFGASTGAAAALIAASSAPELVSAIVSRGGRPDLAPEALGTVQAPTLFLVGELDETVLTLNQAAIAELSAPARLIVVPGATHLFEEPGALEIVAQSATRWFAEHLAPPAAIKTPDARHAQSLPQH